MTYDLAIVGSGFGGSLLAMVARRIGLSVLLLEKGRHPRFAIGESTSPLANLILEELALRYDLPRLLPLSTFGAWQQAYPEMGCGLKRGFTYFEHSAGQRRAVRADRSDQLLVAASPHDDLADTHWLRSDVDTFFVREAIASGVEYRDQVCIDAPVWDADKGALLAGKHALGQEFTARARFVIDATGPHGFLSRALNLPDVAFSDYPATQALFTHFRGVGRCGDLPAFGTDNAAAPYPLDDAALHHVFEGGWIWVLRFGNGVTSAGIAVRDTLAREIGLQDGAAAWKRFLARFPSIGEQFAEAEPVLPFVHAPRLSYRASQAAGPGWCLLPSAAAFVDPLFSTGIPLTLLGIERLGRILEESWGQPDFAEQLAHYGTVTLNEADATADFIGACYAAMGHFEHFAALSQFYFAAASYSEMTRRLGKRHLVRRFLASDHATFGPAMRQCTAQARAQGTAGLPDTFTEQVARAIDCLNIAGLCDARKRNWYPVDLADLVINSHKLEMSRDAMQAVIADADWARGPV